MSDANPFNVRRAEPDDYDALLFQALYLSKEDAVQPVSEVKISEMVKRCVTMDGALAGIVDGHDHTIFGSVGLILDQHPFTDDDHLAARWLGTSENYRQFLKRKRGFTRDYLGVTSRLLRFAKWASDNMGVPLFFDVLTTRYLEPKLNAASRHLRQVGGAFCWGLVDPDRQFFDQFPYIAGAAEGAQDEWSEH
jgi:hypothetical protein